MKHTQKIILSLVIVIVLVSGIFYVNGNRVSEDVKKDEISSSTDSDRRIGMSFFITSVNPGKGGDLGGLAGADAYCQKLAESAGMGSMTWRAYLSGLDENGNTVNARERIGSGPWHNAKGVLIASSVEDLHSNNQINKENGLNEKGEIVMGRGDSVNRHDILTGSNPDGTLYIAPENADSTCSNWTSSGEGSAIVGHHDRIGLNDTLAAKSWNSSHNSRGCSSENFKSTGGDGLFYCFAVR